MSQLFPNNKYYGTVTVKLVPSGSVNLTPLLFPNVGTNQGDNGAFIVVFQDTVHGDGGQIDYGTTSAQWAGMMELQISGGVSSVWKSIPIVGQVYADGAQPGSNVALVYNDGAQTLYISNTNAGTNIEVNVTAYKFF